MPNRLSTELDYALYMEEQHRTQLLYWRYERQRLERQIETETTAIINELEQLATEAFNDDRLCDNQG